MIVLIVEDQESMARLWERFLQPLGEEPIRWAQTLEEALVMMAKMPPPDLVLLDLRVPPCEPETTLTYIHKLKAFNPRAAVLVLTGLSEVTLPLLAAKLGADGFALKQSVASQNLLLSAVKGAISKTVESSEKPYARTVEILEKLSGLVTST